MGPPIVDALDFDAAVRAAEANEAPGPIFRYEEHGAHFTIQPVPKNVRHPGGRAIGGRNLPGGVITPHEAIKSAIERKAGRYGELGMPFIVAVNSLEIYARAANAVDALFGTEDVVVPEDGPPRAVRNRDGAWHGRAGPIHTRVSGVLSTERLSPWDLGHRSARLILNPWARAPLPPDIPIGIEVRHVIDDHLVTEPGLSLREIFELPEGWPE